MKSVLFLLFPEIMQTIEDPRWFFSQGTTQNWERMSEEAEQALEQHMLDSTQSLRLAVGRFWYVYDLERMTQKNEETGTVRDIRRDVVRVKRRSDVIRFDAVTERAMGVIEVFPALAFWSREAPRHNGHNHARVPVEPGSDEWAFVESKFRYGQSGQEESGANGAAGAVGLIGSTSPVQAEIVAVWRVQNNIQAMQHVHKVAEMQEVLDGDGRGVKVHALQLFHGTRNPGNVHVICDSAVGIDRNFSASLGSANMYGKGAYFGLAGVSFPKYTHRVPGTDLHSVFLVNVLLGESCVGDHTMYVPPTKPGSNSRFEATTDAAAPASPRIWVTYRDHQAVVTHILHLRDTAAAPAPVPAPVPAAPVPVLAPAAPKAAKSAKAPVAPTAPVAPQAPQSSLKRDRAPVDSVVVGSRVRMNVKGYGVHEGTVEHVDREKKKCDVAWDDGTTSKQALGKCANFLL